MNKKIKYKTKILLIFALIIPMFVAAITFYQFGLSNNIVGSVAKNSYIAKVNASENLSKNREFVATSIYVEKQQTAYSNRTSFNSMQAHSANVVQRSSIGSTANSTKAITQKVVKKTMPLYGRILAGILIPVSLLLLWLLTVYRWKQNKKKKELQKIDEPKDHAN